MRVVLSHWVGGITVHSGTAVDAGRTVLDIGSRLSGSACEGTGCVSVRPVAKVACGDDFGLCEDRLAAGDAEDDGRFRGRVGIAAVLAAGLEDVGDGVEGRRAAPVHVGIGGGDVRGRV